MSEQKIPFLQLFSAWRSEPEVMDGLRDLLVKRAVIDPAERTLRAELEEAPRLEGSLLSRLEGELREVYRLQRVELIQSASAAPPPEIRPPIPAPAPVEAPAPGGVDAGAAEAFARTEAIRQEALRKLKAARPKATPKAAAKSSRLLFGKREVKGAAAPMNTLELDMGTVTVEGDVFAIDHKELKKRGAWVVSFDMTDYTGSVRINKFFPGEEGKPIVDGVKKGQHLVVQGRLNIDRFTNDMVLEPYAIMEGSRAVKTDDAPEKRVELHLHTTMSSMDALTQVGPKLGPDKNVVKRAESWGHRAIAITDHGVAQSFPDAWHSAKKIKILYGVEAYFVNDVDDRVVVHGETEQDFSGRSSALISRPPASTRSGTSSPRSAPWCCATARWPRPSTPLPTRAALWTGTSWSSPASPTRCSGERLPRKRPSTPFWTLPPDGPWPPTTRSSIWALSPRDAAGWAGPSRTLLWTA